MRTFVISEVKHRRPYKLTIFENGEYADERKFEFYDDALEFGKSWQIHGDPIYPRSM